VLPETLALVADLQQNARPVQKYQFLRESRYPIFLGCVQIFDGLCGGMRAGGAAFAVQSALVSLAIRQGSSLT
jgi:hypothetical protein